MAQAPHPEVRRGQDTPDSWNTDMWELETESVQNWDSDAERGFMISFADSWEMEN